MAKQGRRAYDDEPTMPEKGHFVQWAKNGNGFVPATQTFDTLKPGAYGIVFVNDIATFVQLSVVTDDLVRLPDSKSDEVVSEIQKFWTLEETFRKYGYNHKRGFLLHGPPGSGKTATVTTVIAQMVERGGVVVVADGETHPNTMALMLSRFREIEVKRPLVIIMEDLDALIKNYGESDILAILDGEKSVSNAVFIATTNYPEDLDGRITNRPSRFDRVVEIPVPNAESRKIYFESRELGINEEEIAKWVKATEGMSIAHCKELVVAVMCFGDTFEAAIARLSKMKRAPQSNDKGRSMGFGADDDD